MGVRTNMEGYKAEICGELYRVHATFCRAQLLEKRLGLSQARIRCADFVNISIKCADSPTSRSVKEKGAIRGLGLAPFLLPDFFHNLSSMLGGF